MSLSPKASKALPKAVLTALALASLAFLVSCTVWALPRDADLILSSHYDSGIVSRTYSNAAVYPDRIVELPKYNVSEYYEDYPEYSRISQAQEGMAFRKYDVTVSEDAFEMDVSEDLDGKRPSGYSEEARATDERIAADIMSQLDCGTVTSRDTDVEWSRNSGNLELDISAIGDYRIVSLSDTEDSPHGFAQVYADGIVYHGSDFVGQFKDYGIDSYYSFVLER